MMVVRLSGLFAALLLASTFATAQTAAKPTDPQIGDIAYTAGQIDVKAAHLALAKSKNKAVQSFAKDMVRDHTAVNKKALALLKQLKVKPEDNSTSRSLVKQATAERAKLAKLSGAAFDKAYVANEVAYHKEVDNALQNTLIRLGEQQPTKGASRDWAQDL